MKRVLRVVQVGDVLCYSIHVYAGMLSFGRNTCLVSLVCVAEYVPSSNVSVIANRSQEGPGRHVTRDSMVVEELARRHEHA